MTQEEPGAMARQPFGLTCGSIALISLTVILIIGFVPTRLQIQCGRENANVLCTPTPTTPTETPTHTPTSTPTPTHTYTPTPTPTSTYTPTPTPTYTPTPTPTSTPTLTPTPDYVTGVVNVGEETRLMLRLRPVKDLAIIERLKNGTDVIVLGRTDDSEWFRVLVPSSGNQGWVDPNFIILDDPSEFAEIPGLNPILVRTPEEATEVELLDLVNDQRGTLAPGESRAYRFTAKDVETILILVFRPNVNPANQQLEFVISQEGQPIGVGGSYNELLEGTGLGGLTWRGGTPGESYFLDIFNHSSEPVEFCLSPREVFEWVCD